MNWVPAGPAWLFCPADRPERYEKASARADVVIVDLEDAVGAADKAAARESVIATPLDPARTIVRVNAHGTDDQAADLEALKQTEYTTVMLPKCESAEQIASLAPLNVVALIESPLGALAVFDSLAADNAIGAMWGAEDLVATMGGNSSRRANGVYRAVAQQVRSQTLLAAKARGLFALDSVYLDIPDLDGVRTEADDAVAIGFDGKVAIHPSHIPVIRGAYAPSPEDLEWATAVLDAVSHNLGVFTFREQMVDAPVLAHARRIVARSSPS